MVIYKQLSTEHLIILCSMTGNITDLPREPLSLPRLDLLPMINQHKLLKQEKSS